MRIKDLLNAKCRTAATLMFGSKVFYASCSAIKARLEYREFVVQNT